MNIECIWNGKNLLGECPVWHPIEKKLYWIDAIKPALHCLDINTNAHQYWDMPALIGSIAPREEGGLIAALGSGIAFIDTSNGSVVMQNNILGVRSDVHLNDGKCDRQGRFWVGTVSHDQEHPNGILYRFDTDGSAHQMLQDIRISNGLDVSPDQQTLYFTDSPTQSIYSFDFESSTGNITNKKMFADLEGQAGVPDGLTVDSEGYVWSAIWDGHKVIRFTPNGDIDREIELPIQRPTSLVFGGDDLKTLFVTSCSQDINEENPLSGPNAGALFAIRLDIKGLNAAVFKG